MRYQNDYGDVDYDEYYVSQQESITKMSNQDRRDQRRKEFERNRVRDQRRNNTKRHQQDY